MNRHALLSLLALLLCCSTSLPAQKAKTYIPWKNGKLVVSEEGRYLKHENGVPFFWLGETGWLMPQRLNRDEVSYYLNKCKDAGYNMVQVQVLNGVPSMNIYGQYSMTDGFNFKDINRKGIYGYWDHMDYIIKSAASRGIYIGMVCIWGTPVEQGLMNEKEAVAYGIEENTEEDNWRFVEASQAKTPLKPVIDDEPIYEDIPQGLHDPNETRWNQHDVRRYAYWSVFAGSFGHSYGHNDIMQFIRPGYGASFGADGRKKAWWDALEDPGFNQMKYLKNLMLTFPFFERVPDQSVIAGTNGERYDRAIATRGNDYLLVYNYSGRPMQIDLSKISGAKKNAWWYSAKDGKLEYIGEFDSKVTSFQHDSGYLSGNDQVLIVVDSAKDYVQKAWTALPDAIQKWNK